MKSFVCILLLAGCAIVGLETTVFAVSPTGLWYVEGGAAQVEISPCGEQLCGRIVWLRSPFDENGCDLRDINSPDESRRNRKILGLEILRGLEESPDEEGVWTSGTIYDPTNGKTYKCRLTLNGNNRLELRGYIGIPLFGRTATWVRVGSANLMCPQ